MSKSGWGLGICSSVGITELWNANQRVVARSGKRFQRKSYDATREWTSRLLVRRNVREEKKISPVGREGQYLCLPSHFLSSTRNRSGCGRERALLALDRIGFSVVLQGPPRLADSLKCAATFCG